nr:MAG TPA: hypothetical protein [Caudoviricetes sp.]
MTPAAPTVSPATGQAFGKNVGDLQEGVSID